MSTSCLPLAAPRLKLFGISTRRWPARTNDLAQSTTGEDWVCGVCSGAVFLKVFDKPKAPKANSESRDLSSILRHPTTVTANQRRLAALKREGKVPQQFFMNCLGRTELTFPNGERMAITGFQPKAASQHALDSYFIDGSTASMGRPISGHAWRHRVMTILMDYGIDQNLAAYILGHKQVQTSVVHAR